MRVVWTSSNGAEVFSPKNGVVMENLDYKEEKGAWHKYGVSKAGNIFHASEFARRFGGEGILSVVSTYSSINRLKLELGVVVFLFPFLFFFLVFLEKNTMLITRFCNNRVSIPVGSRPIYRGMYPGTWPYWV